MSFFGKEDEKPASPVLPIREAFSRRIEVEPKKRTRGTEDRVHSFTMRVTVKASNKLIDFCEKNNLSYRQAFDLMVDKLPE